MSTHHTTVYLSKRQRDEDVYLDAMYELRKLVRVWVGRWHTRNGSLANRKVA